jgi:hypothetical protein
MMVLEVEDILYIRSNILVVVVGMMISSVWWDVCVCVCVCVSGALSLLLHHLYSHRYYVITVLLQTIRRQVREIVANNYSQCPQSPTNLVLSSCKSLYLILRRIKLSRWW